jgi:hypothetical protein
VLVGHLKPSNTLLYRIEPAERLPAVGLDVHMQLLKPCSHVVHTGRQANHSVPAFPAAGAKSADTHGPNCDGRTYDGSSDFNHGRGKTYEQRIDPDRWRYLPWPRRFLRPLALLLTELPMLVFL